MQKETARVPIFRNTDPKPRSCKWGFSFLLLGICYVYLLYLAEKSVRAVNVVSFAKISAVDLVGFEGIPLTNSRKKTGHNTEPLGAPFLVRGSDFWAFSSIGVGGTGTFSIYLLLNPTNSVIGTPAASYLNLFLHPQWAVSQ